VIRVALATLIGAAAVAVLSPVALAKPAIYTHPLLTSEHDLIGKRQGRQFLERPEFLLGPIGDRFRTYFASACWSDSYALALLRAAPRSDPIDPAAWTKSPQPTFQKEVTRGVYALGRNGFFASPDRRESWIVDYANAAAGMRRGKQRSSRIQRFTFDTSGRFDCGISVATAPPPNLPDGTRKPSKLYSSTV